MAARRIGTAMDTKSVEHEKERIEWRRDMTLKLISEHVEPDAIIDTIKKLEPVVFGDKE